MSSRGPIRSPVWPTGGSGTSASPSSWPAPSATSARSALPRSTSIASSPTTTPTATRPGDVLLREASAAWRGALRGADLLSRWGGDEFALLLPDCDLDCAREDRRRGCRRSRRAARKMSAARRGWCAGRSARAPTTWSRAPTPRSTRPRPTAAAASAWRRRWCRPPRRARRRGVVGGFDQAASSGGSGGGGSTGGGRRRGRSRRRARTARQRAGDLPHVRAGVVFVVGLLRRVGGGDDRRRGGRLGRLGLRIRDGVRPRRQARAPRRCARWPPAA